MGKQKYKFVEILASGRISALYFVTSNYSMIIIYYI